MASSMDLRISLNGIKELELRMVFNLNYCKINGPSSC